MVAYLIALVLKTFQQNLKVGLALALPQRKKFAILEVVLATASSLNGRSGRVATRHVEVAKNRQRDLWQFSLSGVVHHVKVAWRELMFATTWLVLRIVCGLVGLLGHSALLHVAEAR